MSNRCCFAGHSQIQCDFESKLKIEIEKMILHNDVNEFWVGNYGNFDRKAAKIVRELKAVHQNIKLYLVLPYTTKTIDNNKKLYYKEFDALLIADIPEKTPKKFQILKCNEYMVNKSDFLICYVKHSFGGAAATLEYAAKKKHIRILNLAVNEQEKGV